MPVIKGEIHWSDFDAKNPFRITGFSPQAQIIDWYTTVSDNILQRPLLSGFSFHKAKSLVKQAAKLLYSPVDHLSRGQQQVQVAREIARPTVYLHSR